MTAQLARKCARATARAEEAVATVAELLSLSLYEQELVAAAFWWLGCSGYVESVG
jgi:hypothetical protein